MELTSIRVRFSHRWEESIRPWLRQPVAGRLTAAWTVVIFILGFVLAVVPFWLVQNPDQDQVLSDILLPTYSLAATLVVLTAGRKSLIKSRRAGYAWLVIGLAMFFNSLGEISWSYFDWIGQDPFPSLADIFYLSSYPTMLAGILLLPFEHRNRVERFSKLLEIGIISLSGGLMMWNYLIGPLIGLSEDLNIVELVVTLSYPMFDLLLLLALLALIFRTSEVVWLRPLMFLGLGIVSWIFSDVNFSLQELQEGYQVGGIADVGYLFSSIFWGLSGLCQYRSQQESIQIRARKPRRSAEILGILSPYIRASLPAIMLLFIYHMLWKSMSGEIAMRLEGMMIWMGVLLLLVNLVQVVYTHENVQLNQQLKKSNAELEQRVEERTHTLINMTDALRTSEERYRIVVEDTPALVCTYLPGGILTFVNKAYAHYFDKKPEDLIGQSFYHLVSPEDRQLLDIKISSLSIDNPVIVTEHRVLSPDGEVRWQRWVDRITVEGDIVRYQAIGEDVTEQRTAAERLRESEERYRMLFETMAQGVVYQNCDGQIISANPAAEHILGLSIDQMRGRQSIDPRWKAVHEDGSDFPGETHPAMVALRTGKVVVNVVMGVYNPVKQEYSWINVNAVPEFIPGDAYPFRVYTTFEDITDRKKNERALQDANEQLKHGLNELSLLAQMDELLQLCQTDEEAYQAINSVIEKIFPFERGVVSVAQRDGSYKVQVVWGNSEHTSLVQANQCLALRRGRPFFVSDSRRGLVCEHIRAHGPISSMCVPMIAQNEIYGSLQIEADLLDGHTSRLDESRQQLASMVGNSIALSLSNIRLRARLRDQAIRDSLTGLFNRRFMEESLSRELLRAVRSQQQLGVLMLDIDHFKVFNDRYGHEAGDRLLIEAAESMRKCVRGSDVICRYGGEEFVIVLPETAAETILERADRLRLEISQLHLAYEGELLEPVTVSVGVAMYPKDGQTPQDLLRRADQALYMAKEAGRNRVSH